MSKIRRKGEDPIKEVVGKGTIGKDRHAEGDRPYRRLRLYKRLMFAKMLRDNTPEGRALCVQQTYLALKTACASLMKARVVGCFDPFV
jgi:hypothetical protein